MASSHMMTSPVVSKLRLMLDSRVVDLRMVSTHHLPFPNPWQESELAGPYHKSDR